MAIGSGAGTLTQGQRKLADVGASRRVPQYIGKTFNISAQCAPFYLLMDKLGQKKTVHQASFFHLETDWLPTSVTVSGSYDSAVTSITLASGHGKRVKVGTILYNYLTGEALRVSAVSGDVLTVETRGYGTGNTAAAIAASQELSIQGGASADGAGAPDAISSEPSLVTNYCQIFRQSIELTGRDQESENYGEAEYQRQFRDAQESLLTQVETTFLFSEMLRSADPFQTAGLPYWITTNNTSIGGTLGEQALIDSFITPLFRRNKKKKLLVIAGEKFLRAIDIFGRDYIRYQASESVLGMEVTSYRCIFGEINILNHGLMAGGTAGSVDITAANNGPQGWAFGLNLENLGKAQFAGRFRKHRKNIETPGTDGMKEEILTDEGLYVANEQGHAILRGITG